MSDQEVDKGSLRCLRVSLTRAAEAMIRLEESSLCDATLTGRNREHVETLRFEVGLAVRRLEKLLRDAPRLTLHSAQAQDLDAPEDTDLAIPRLDGLRRVMVEDFAPAVAEWLNDDKDRFIAEAAALRAERPPADDLITGVVIDLGDAIARLPRNQSRPTGAGSAA